MSRAHVTEPLDLDELDEALGVQIRMKDLWARCGEPTGGWKVGFTTGDPASPGDNRKKIPPDARPFGFVLRSRILESGAALSRSRIKSIQVEPELYLRLAGPLRGAVGPDQARAAVDLVGAAFEVNESRYVSTANPLPIRLAAGLNNWGMIIGSGIAPPDWDVRTTTVTTSRDGAVESTVTRSEGTFDDPYESLARLSARLDAFGLGLEAGDHVITGAFAHHKVDANATWAASFTGIGDVSVSFTD